MGSTLAACGDVNRNVLSSPAPYKNRPDYEYATQYANDIADLLAPQSGAYYDVWLDGEKFFSHEMEVWPAASLRHPCSYCNCAVVTLKFSHRHAVHDLGLTSLLAFCVLVGCWHVHCANFEVLLACTWSNGQGHGMPYTPISRIPMHAEIVSLDAALQAHACAENSGYKLPCYL